MNFIPHPRYSDIQRWFAEHGKNSSRPLQRRFARVVGPTHTSAQQITSGVGAFKAGGRWNAPWLTRVVYASDDPATAMHEALANLRYYRISPWGEMPKLVVALEVVIESAIDLTDPTLASDLPMPMEDMMSEDWRAMNARHEESTTQAVGRAAFESGLQGLLVPSNAYKPGFNVLVFLEHLSSTCRLEVLNSRLLAKPADAD